MDTFSPYMFPFIAMLIAFMAVPAAIVTAIGAGAARVTRLSRTWPALVIALVGSVMPALMLLYGMHCARVEAAQKAAHEKIGDMVSLSWWLLASAPPSWILCLLVAWPIIRARSRS